MTTATLRAHRNGTVRDAPPQVRVAVYTRKSVEKGLDQPFTSIDAQRDACIAFIRRQPNWALVAEEYEDSGFTGANTNRPAYQRLLQDIEAGKVTAVCVYRGDRLTRSLLDLLRFIEFADQHGCVFVSATEPIETATIHGRLLTQTLSSYAEYERSLISARTRDKVWASRRRGIWTGGRPVLGYDVVAGKLVVNPDEAERVRAIFQLFADSGSVMQVVEELRQRRWTSKSWTNQNGQLVQGSPFSKVSLRGLLTNVLYVGQVSLGDETHPGVHQAIVMEQVWTSVQVQLKLQRRENLPAERNKHGCLLKSILWCGVCQSAMTFHYVKRGAKRYGAYVCARYQKNGAAACPGSRIAVRIIEGHVVDRIKAIGRDQRLVAEVIEAAHRELETRGPKLEAELQRIDLDKRAHSAERKRLVAAVGNGADAVPALVARLKEVEQALAELSQRADESRQQLDVLKDQTINEADLRAALARFDPIWNELFPTEKARLLALLIERVTYDSRSSEVSITFRPGGVRSLAARDKGDEQ